MNEIEEFKLFIEENKCNLNKINLYINSKKIFLTKLNKETLEIVLFSIECHASHSIIKMLINKYGNYSFLKYCIDTHNLNALSLFFKIFTYDNQFILNIIKLLKNNPKNLTEHFMTLINDEKCKIKIPISFYKTALTHRHYDTLKLLLENETPETILVINDELDLFSNAVQDDNLMIVKILANYAVDITKKSIYLPVLKTASENGYLDILQYLLDVGNVDINEVFSYGFTALMIAVKKDLLPVVQFLIEHGANIYYKDNNNNTALLLGVRYNRSQIINYLVEKEGKFLFQKDSNGKKALLIAMKYEYNDIAKILLKYYPEINEKDEHGNSLIHIAIQHNQKDLVNDLIRRGVLLNNLDCCNNTPLLLSIKEGYYDIALELLENKVDIHTKDNVNDTALIISARKGRLELVIRLIQQGAKMSDKNKEGFTPLFSAYTENHTDVLIYMLENTSNVNEKNSKGETLLMCAVKDNNIMICNYLIQRKKININSKDNEGNTALILASQKDNFSLVKYLVENGANVHEKNNQLKDALYYSSKEYDYNKYIYDFLEPLMNN